MRQVAADALGLAPDQVTARLGDTRLPASHPSIGSATMAYRNANRGTGDALRIDAAKLFLSLSRL
jgi:CO/xanthine dehydrogenase Mo-binding subunit